MLEDQAGLWGLWRSNVILGVVENHWKVYIKEIAFDFTFTGWRINCKVMGGYQKWGGRRLCLYPGGEMLVSWPWGSSCRDDSKWSSS